MLDDILRGTNVIVVETFDHNYHVFSLIKDNQQFFLQLKSNPKLITKLVIKPDLWVFFKEGGYEHGVKLLKPIDQNMKKVLAKDYLIDPDIFDLLIQNNLISYSKAMADLYELPNMFCRDIKYHSNDYKRSKSKELTLMRMKHGIFN